MPASILARRTVMKLRDLMSRDVRCIGPDARLHEAARLMQDRDVGSLPVCGADRLAGMITDRDIVIRSVAAGTNPDDGRVRDVMTPKIVYCFDDDDVEQGARLMKREQIRRLPILNHD